MAQTIKLKRSAVAGRIPNVSDLELGEIAINTYDGKMYIKKSVNGEESISEIGQDANLGAVFTSYTFTATANQTVFTGNDNSGNALDIVDEFSNVFMNGILLDPEIDFTVSSDGLTLTLTEPAEADDILQINSFDQAIFNGTLNVDALALTGMAGQMVWNSDEETIDVPLNDDVTLQLGQEFVFRGKATEAISNGDVVMFAGAQGGHLLIAKADMSSVGFAPEYVIGIATQDFNTNDFGFVTELGKVRGLDTSGYSEGDILYLDPTTPGALTVTKPIPPSHAIQMCAVVNSHITQGTLLVRPTHMADTDEIAEGSSNLYFTVARAVAAIKADGDWNASDWDTSYGWGDHSAQNYAVTTGDTFTGIITSTAATVIETPYARVLWKDNQFNAELIKQTWLSGVGDYLSFKAGGSGPNVEHKLAETYADLGGYLKIEGITVIDSVRNITGASITGSSLTVNGSGQYVAGSIYSDANWGMIFRAKQASPNNAQYRWADSADTELMRIDNSGNLDLESGGYRINGTTVINPNRNITNIGSITTLASATNDMFWLERNDTSGITSTLRNNTGGNTLRLYGDYANNGALCELQIQAGKNGDYAQIGTWTNQPLYLKTNNSNKVAIETNGDLRVMSGGLKIGTITAIDSSRNITCTNLTPTPSGGSVVGGGRFLTPFYTSGHNLPVFSTQYSSGSLLIGYGVEGDTATTGYKSTYSNFTGHRAAIKVNSDGINILGTTIATNAPVGSTISLEESFSVSTSTKITKIHELLLDTGANYRDTLFTQTGALGNGTLEIMPNTMPGSGTANYYTHFKNNGIVGSGGATRHHVRIDGDLQLGGTTVIDSSRNATFADLTISGNGSEINFTGSNNRIKFSGYRAMEGTTDGGSLHLAEQYTQVNSLAHMNLSPGHDYRIAGTTVIDSARNAELASTLKILSAYEQATILRDARTSTSGSFHSSIVWNNYQDNNAAYVSYEHNDYFGSAPKKIHLGFGATNSNNRLSVGVSSTTLNGNLDIHTTAQNAIEMFEGSGSSGYTWMRFLNNTGTTQYGSIYRSFSSMVYGTSSDYRLKENVVDLTNAADRINAIPVRRFNFLEHPDRTVDGFLAHEVQEIVPEAIIGEKDAIDEDGNPVYQGIDQSKLVPLLTAGLQEALAGLEEAKTEIQNLKARLSALEN